MSWVLLLPSFRNESTEAKAAKGLARYNWEVLMLGFDLGPVFNPHTLELGQNASHLSPVYLFKTLLVGTQLCLLSLIMGQAMGLC